MNDDKNYATLNTLWGYGQWRWQKYGYDQFGHGRIKLNQILVRILR